MRVHARQVHQALVEQRRLAQQTILEDRDAFTVELPAGRHGANPRFDPPGCGPVTAVPPFVHAFDRQHDGGEQQNDGCIENRGHASLQTLRVRALLAARAIQAVSNCRAGS